MKELENLGEIILEMDKINKKIADLKNQVAKECKVNITAQDARLVALDGIHQHIVSSAYWIITLE